MSSQTHITQRDKLIWTAINGERSLWLWKHVLIKIILSMNPPPLLPEHSNHSGWLTLLTIISGWDFQRCCVSASLLMKTMENFSGVHTWLTWKAFEHLLDSFLSALLLWLPKLWAHRYTEPGPRICYTVWLLVVDSLKKLGIWRLWSDLILSSSSGDWICNSCFQPLLQPKMKMITLAVQYQDK